MVNSDKLEMSTLIKPSI